MPKSKTISPSELKPDKNNANKGTEVGREILLKSLQDNGAGRSILLDKHNNIIAGNKTFEAALKLGLPVRVIPTEGDEIIAVQRTNVDLYDEEDTTGRNMAYQDNRASELGLYWDEMQIAEDFMSGFVDESVFDKSTLDGFIERAKGSLESSARDSQDAGEGSGLAKISLTIEDPVTNTEEGDVWRVGAHIMAVMSVVHDVGKWRELLEEEMLFIPYPGPMVLMSEKLEDTRALLIQPDTYIAGHILDRYKEQYGGDSIGKN